jgi:hypothetical protein
MRKGLVYTLCDGNQWSPHLQPVRETLTEIDRILDITCESDHEKTDPDIS